MKMRFFHITKRVTIEQAASISIEKNQSQVSSCLPLVHHFILYTANLCFNHGSHCHPSVVSLAPLVIAGSRIVSAAEVGTQVKDTLDVNAWDVRCGDRTYTDVFSLSRPR